MAKNQPNVELTSNFSDECTEFIQSCMSWLESEYRAYGMANSDFDKLYGKLEGLMDSYSCTQVDAELFDMVFELDEDLAYDLRNNEDMLATWGFESINLINSDALEVVTSALDCGDTLIVSGFSQRWNGSSSGYAVIDGLDDFSEYTGLGTDENGDLSVTNAHHDGTNTYSIRAVTLDGDIQLQEILDRDELYSFSDLESDDLGDVFNDSKLSRQIELF